MMIAAGSFLALLAYASSASIETCLVGSWGPWSECQSSKHCPAEKIPWHHSNTWALQATAEWDEGRTVMKHIMKQKLLTVERNKRCMAEGTCPELLRQPIPGAHKCVNGIAGDIPCKFVDQSAYLNFPQLGYSAPIPGDVPEGNDVWGWTDPDTGDEYAIMGVSGGTSFVRVTDHDDPVTVGFMYSATTYSLWRDIKVIGNFAYVVSEARDHGLQVFDLTHLRGRNTLAFFQPDATNNEFGNAHNIAANADTNYLYVVGATQSGPSYSTCGGGLLVFDVSDPLKPTRVGCFGADGYTHDTQCVVYHGPHVEYQGREICFAFNENSLTIVDVTDKSAMTMIYKTNYPNVGYTHQGWVTEDHELLVLDDEFDEMRKPVGEQHTMTYVWDIRVLTNPQLKTVFQSAATTIDHNQYIIGDYVFQANYESGLRINKINRDTFELSNVAYFDVYPDRDAANFEGAWSVYPFFKSGTVLISSINHGLFIVRPDWESINAYAESNTTYAQQTRRRPILSAALGSTCPHQVETRSCQATVLC